MRHRLGGVPLRAALTEARVLLALAPASAAPTPEPTTASRRHRVVQRLWRACGPIDGTAAEAYLAARGITARRFPTLRFHPALEYRDETGTRTYPALVAAVTDTSARLAGVHRTYLDPERPAKARVAHPRKSLGPLQHHSVRFTPSGPLTGASTLLIGEGIETVLSLVSALPHLPAAAALSAGQLGAFHPPPGTRALLIARDNDPAGERAGAALAERVHQADFPAVTVLAPVHGDFNEDLLRLGRAALAGRLRKALRQGA